MKKLMLLISVMLLCLISFALVSCNAEKNATTTAKPLQDITTQGVKTEDVTPVSNNSVTENGIILKYADDKFLITVDNEDDETKFMEIMDSAQWEDGKWKTRCPILLILDEHTMYYYSPVSGLVEDRRLYPINNTARYFYLTEEQKELVNSFITPYYPNIHAL